MKKSQNETTISTRLEDRKGIFLWKVQVAHTPRVVFVLNVIFSPAQLAKMTRHFCPREDHIRGLKELGSLLQKTGTSKSCKEWSIETNNMKWQYKDDVLNFSYGNGDNIKESVTLSKSCRANLVEAGSQLLYIAKHMENW